MHSWYLSREVQRNTGTHRTLLQSGAYFVPNFLVTISVLSPQFPIYTLIHLFIHPIPLQNVLNRIFHRWHHKSIKNKPLCCTGTLNILWDFFEKIYFYTKSRGRNILASIICLSKCWDVQDVEKQCRTFRISPDGYAPLRTPIESSFIFLP